MATRQGEGDAPGSASAMAEDGTSSSILQPDSTDEECMKWWQQQEEAHQREKQKELEEAEKAQKRKEFEEAEKVKAETRGYNYLRWKCEMAHRNWQMSYHEQPLKATELKQPDNRAPKPAAKSAAKPAAKSVNKSVGTNQWAQKSRGWSYR